MDHGPLLAILLLLAVGLPMVVVARRLRVGALSGYVLAGAAAGLLGRHVDAFASVNAHTLQPFAEVGVAFLLFSLGLELDLTVMRKRLRQILVAAVGQIGLTIAAATGLVHLLGLPIGHAFAVGCCLVMTSTVFLLRGLEERGLRRREEGELTIGLSLVQDLALAPMLLCIGLVIPGAATAPPIQVLIGLGGFLVATVLMRQVVGGALINRVRGLQVPELEVAFAVIFALGAAALASHAGLGAAVGAFCAGLALGGTDQRQVVEASIKPLMGLTAIIFFASMGVLFDPGFVADHAVEVLVALVVSMLVKAVLSAFALRLAGLNVRSSIGGGILVANIGEFSFVLAATAFAGSADPEIRHLYQLVVSVTCLSLLCTPALVALAVRFLPEPAMLRVTDSGETVVVAGLGPVGNTVVDALRERGHRLFLVDRNARLLKPWEGIPGIITHLGRIEDMDDWLPVLGHRPPLVVLTFPVADTSAAVAARLIALDPALTVIARAPFQRQITLLRTAGVHYVICDEEAVAGALAPLLSQALSQTRTVMGRPAVTSRS